MSTDLPLVKPKTDFECLAIFTEHDQDIKCVSWHPAEEVVFPSLMMQCRILTSTFASVDTRFRLLR